MGKRRIAARDESLPAATTLVFPTPVPETTGAKAFLPRREKQIEVTNAQ